MIKQLFVAGSLIMLASLNANASDTQNVEAETSQEETTQEVASFVIDGDAKKGKKVFKKCKACHQVKKEKNGAGPHLVGLLGRDIGSVEGYKYSQVFSEKDGQWTPEELTAFLKAPKEYAPGNKMSFKGLKKDADIENLIAYLNEF